MKKTILSICIVLLSLTSFAQSKTEYSTLWVCSQEYTILNKEKNIYELQNTYRCNECKIMFNDYYIRVIEDGKETFTLDKSNYYKSSDVENTTFFRNKYSDAFMQVDKNNRWIAFGIGEYKFIYNYCLKQTTFDNGNTSIVINLKNYLKYLFYACFNLLKVIHLQSFKIGNKRNKIIVLCFTKNYKFYTIVKTKSYFYSPPKT